MKTEALETVRNPPFRELSQNYENNWPHICPRETEASYGHRQIHLCFFSRRSLVDPGSPFALLQEEHVLSGRSPVNGDEHSAERRFTGSVYSKETGERKLSALRFFLVGCVMLYEALSDCAKAPMSYSIVGTECSLHQHQQNLLQFLLYILYLLGQFTKRAI